MATQTVTEKDMFVATFEREGQITLRLMRHYPADQLDLRPTDKLADARGLLWMMVLSQGAVNAILDGELLPSEKGFPPAPKTHAEILAAFESMHGGLLARLKTITDDDFNGTVRTIVGPQQRGDARKGDKMWMMLMDTVHHRGQLSVFQRIAGGKVPSIYGPSGDEPW